MWRTRILYWGCSPKLLRGDNCKINPTELTAVMNSIPMNSVHESAPSALSLTQSTDTGTVYNIDEIQELTNIAKKYNVPTHMDGARFANALISLNCSPADITWKSGIDSLTFGATKNGAMMAESVIFFNEDQANDFLWRQKRSGHLISKLRFISSQLDSYIKNDLWLNLAKHSNEMANKLTAGIKKYKNIAFLCPCQTNQLFLLMEENLVKYLEDNNALFHRLPFEGKTLIRLVTNFQTKEQEIKDFLGLIEKYHTDQ